MNKYEILQNIGEGEYGVVQKAKNKETGQLVAIKKFKEDDSDQENKKVILREVKILKTLNHENVIQLKEAFRKKGKIYLVCEYVEKNLLEILEEGPIHANQVRNITYQLLKGIRYMHSLNIIHRDIKPQNVLIGRDDRVKICDLGFARTIPNNGKMTDYVATRWYRPPELLIGKDEYDKSIDMWSIGCVLAQIIDGEPLFGGENDLDQLYLIQKCLGPLTPNHQEYFLKNPKFIGMKFPEIQNLQSIDRRYFGKIDKHGIDLLKRMLKMDPKNRISVDDALNHPFFGKSSSHSEIESKRHKIYQSGESDKRYEENVHQLISNHSNHFNISQHHQKSHFAVNNFLDDKNKDQKIGVNKVTGLSKIKKNIAGADIIGIVRQNHQFKEEESTKGKSLNNKGRSIKQKYGALTEKAGQQKTILKARNAQIDNKINNADYEEYYEEKWQNEDETNEEKEEIGEKKKSERNKMLVGKDDESPKKEESKQQRVKKSRNLNIVFNSNTYNLNLIDPYS